MHQLTVIDKLITVILVLLCLTETFMSTSKITTKFQATIPRDIRKKLHIKAGDLISFEILDDNTVIVKRARQIDKDYLDALNSTLSEWKSNEDEEAYDDLQAL